MSDLDRKLHEMMGKCWHDLRFDDAGNGWVSYKCELCGHTQEDDPHNPSYLDPIHYWELLQWCKGQERWFDFLVTIGWKSEEKPYGYWDTRKLTEILLDSARGCSAIANFDWGKK